MKQEHDLLDLVQIYEIATFAAQLLRAQEVAAACGERATSSRHIKAIIPGNAKVLFEKVIGCLLKASVRTRNYERRRPVRLPLTKSTDTRCHRFIRL